ncbi:MAG: hypothetical protein ACLQVD_15895 [Capsulimonadaceae bacterium]
MIAICVGLIATVVGFFVALFRMQAAVNAHRFWVAPSLRCVALGFGLSAGAFLVRIAVGYQVILVRWAEVFLCLSGVATILRGWWEYARACRVRQ